METGKMINRISNRLRRRSKKAQETIGITGAKGNILDYILVESEKHNVYQKEIEKEFGLRPSTATEVLKSLEDAGLIVRIPDETDGRFKKIVFTQKAEEIRSARTELQCLCTFSASSMVKYRSATPTPDAPSRKQFRPLRLVNS